MKASAILETVSVTSYVSFPGLTSRSAASLARWAANIASALRPVTWDKHSVTKLNKQQKKFTQIQLIIHYSRGRKFQPVIWPRPDTECQVWTKCANAKLERKTRFGTCRDFETFHSLPILFKNSLSLVTKEVLHYMIHVK